MWGHNWYPLFCPIVTWRVATHTIKVEMDHKFYDAYGVCTPCIYAHSSFHALDRMGEFWYITKKNLLDNCAALDFMSKGINSLNNGSHCWGKFFVKNGFFGPTKCSLEFMKFSARFAASAPTLHSFPLTCGWTSLPLQIACRFESWCRLSTICWEVWFLSLSELC